MEELIKKWKEFNIDRAEFEFYAGGDSMGDTELYFYDKNNKGVIVDFAQEIENEIYNNVEFYENSDGHYQGESGTVYVRLLEEEDCEPEFTFEKDAQSQYSESYSDEVKVELNEDQYKYLEKYVEDIEETYSDDLKFSYKIDFFVSPEKQFIEDSIRESIRKECNEHEFEHGGEIEDSDCHNITDLILLGDNKISVSLGYRVTTYEASN